MNNASVSWTTHTSTDYPIGSTQTLYVDPSEPQRSYLEQVDPLDVVLPLIVGTIIVMLGLGIAIYTLWNW